MEEESKEIIFISDDLSFKEDYHLKEFQFVNLQNTSDINEIENSFLNSLSLLEISNKLYLMMGLERYGSAFIGNSVRKTPKIVLIKQFNPIFLFMNILSISKENEKKLTLNALIYSYKEKLNGQLQILMKLNKFYNFDKVFKLLDFIENLNLNEDLKQISDWSSTIFQDNEVFCLNFNENKCFIYLKKNIDEILSKFDNNLEKKRNLITIYKNVLNPNLFNMFLSFIKYNVKDLLEINTSTVPSFNNTEKRFEKPEKKEKNEIKKQVKTISKNQQSIDMLFKKK